jgi:hypothetical protein
VVDDPKYSITGFLNNVRRQFKLNVTSRKFYRAKDLAIKGIIKEKGL